MLLAPLPLSATERWAVIVGINDYEAFTDEVGGDLRGPVNDARAVHEALIRRWGFDPERVRLLLDRAATRDAIRESLQEWIPGVAKPGDVVVFYFAGHGSQSWDEDGDEADGLDETLAPYDVLRGSTEKDISDDDLRGWLAGLSDQRVVVILDSCHSGTATRVVTPYARPRMLARRIDTLPRPPGVVPRAAAPPRALSHAPPEFDIGVSHVLEIAASQPDQVAMDVAWNGVSGEEVEWGGAFTRFLVRELWSGALGSSYEDVFFRAARELKLAGFSQDPALSTGGDLRRMPLFGIIPPTSSAGTPPLRVLSSAPAGVALSAPAGSSLMPGALLIAGTVLLEVTEIDGDGVTAAIRSSRSSSAGPPRVPEGALARPLPFPPSLAPLHLSLAGLSSDGAALLARVIDSVAGLVAAPDAPSRVPDLTLRSGGGGVQLVGRDGSIRAQFELGDTAALAATLRREVAFRKLAMLVNPAQTDPVELAFGDDRGWLRLGQQVSLRVRAPHIGYLTVIDLAPDGTISLLFPNQVDRRNEIAAGEIVALPTPAMAAGGLRFEVSEPTGAGMVRALITSVPLELPLTADGRISPEQVVSALAGTLGAAPASAEAATAVVSDWSTTALVYDVQP